jgi:hypothetical protein
LSKGGNPVSKGDHVFNNIVTKLTKAFERGIAECFQSTRKALKGADRQRLSNERGYREIWMRNNMPKTREALDHFRDHPELTVLRGKLQTSVFTGGDANNEEYSAAAEDFEAAVQDFFQELAKGRSVVDSNTLLPDVRAVRRAFLQMTKLAEDPGALARLLDEYENSSSERAQIEHEIELVKKSLGWAWGRCEHLFRMTAYEFLIL